MSYAPGRRGLEVCWPLLAAALVVLSCVPAAPDDALTVPPESAALPPPLLAAWSDDNLATAARLQQGDGAAVISNLNINVESMFNLHNIQWKVSI